MINKRRMFLRNRTIGETCLGCHKDATVKISLGKTAAATPVPVTLPGQRQTQESLTVFIHKGTCQSLYRSGRRVSIHRKQKTSILPVCPGLMGYGRKGYRTVDIHITQAGRDVTLRIQINQADSRSRMVYSALIRRRGRNGKYVPLPTDKMVVPVSIKPSFDIIISQIEPHTIARLENKLVRIAPQIMVEDDDGLAGRLAVQIILDPTEHFLSFESRRMVSA